MKYLSPILPVRVRLAVRSGLNLDFQVVSFRVDTGMDFGATLPLAMTELDESTAERLIPVTVPSVVVGDGRREVMEGWWCEFKVTESEPVEGIAIRGADDPLIGMQAMSGCTLTIDIRDGGRVTLS